MFFEVVIPVIQVSRLPLLLLPGLHAIARIYFVFYLTDNAILIGMVS